jgi:hypothetical protein
VAPFRPPSWCRNWCQPKLRNTHTHSDGNQTGFTVPRTIYVKYRYAIREAFRDLTDRALTAVSWGFASHSCAEPAQNLRNFLSLSTPTSPGGISIWHRFGLQLTPRARSSTLWERLYLRVLLQAALRHYRPSPESIPLSRRACRSPHLSDMSATFET